MKRTKDKIYVLYENRNDTHVSILNYDYKHEDNVYEINAFKIFEAYSACE